MSKEIKSALLARAENKCELCSATENLDPYLIPHSPGAGAEDHLLLCPTCVSELQASELNVNHWFCLKDVAWSQVPAVQVVAYRQLAKLSGESWAQELAEQMYLEDEVRTWAEAGITNEDETSKSPTPIDSNGTPLAEGDTVTVIKELDVKGANFSVKRGTTVRNIRLGDDPTHVEGKVNGSSIFLKTCFLKKI